MTKEQFESEKDYQIALQLIKDLREQGLLTDEEFVTVRAALIERYQPLIGMLSP